MEPLIDNYSRRIRYIRISVTDRCNLRCRYCMPSGTLQWLPHDSIMRYEEFLRIIYICAKRGVEKVRITGGEPLVRRGILGFLEQIGEIDNINDLSLTTNGVFLSSLAKDLRAAGIDRINISLDTLDKDKFAYITRVDALDKVLSGIESALNEGFSP
ncbi:MAG: radical SAM protein, partial [Thermodesulfobacteriota bacterium]|nr:radical SAM protein [Thermodesulfobacteriota bacterium]